MFEKEAATIRSHQIIVEKNYISTVPIKGWLPIFRSDEYVTRERHREALRHIAEFFRLASSDPTIASNLWGFARFAYLDNPLPSLLKERLFVYLSRFCEIRYCIARHVGFLTGLGQMHNADSSSSDLIVTDISMPKLNGIAAAIKIRDSLPGIKPYLSHGARRSALSDEGSQRRRRCLHSQVLRSGGTESSDSRRHGRIYSTPMWP